MKCCRLLRCLMIGITLVAGAPTPGWVVAGQQSQMFRVPSKDGTLIAVECSGSGPSLVIAHGGIGDRTRWTPMFPLLSSRFTVCAMDRRGHGASGDSPDYSLQKEAEDIAAVVDSRPGTVFLLGHSYGGVCALEATFLTKRISKLLLYEPPLQDRIDLGLVGRIEKMIQDGKRDQAVVAFLREVVMVSPSELDAMKSRPAWRRLVDSIDSHPRQMRALAAYRFDAKRMSTMTVPTLLIRGGETAIPDVKRAMSSLMESLPNWTEVVLKGQQHNAMDTGRQQLAEAITTFLLGTNKVSSGYGLFIEGLPSAFFSQFSLRRLAKKNASTAGVLCDEAGIGSGGGGGAGSKQAAYNKFETFSCQLKSSDPTKFDESEFISILKRDVEQEIKQSGLTIRNSQSPDSGSFYLEYEEDAMKGRVEISGERRERYYTLTASLIEEREAKEKQSQ